MRPFLILFFVFLFSCSDDDSPMTDAGTPDAAEPDSNVGDARIQDVNEDAGPLVEILVQDPAAPSVDVLEGTSLDGCEVYREEACVSGVQRRCEVYDPATSEFVTPSPTYERALLFDRWYDLYHQPVGQTAERVFNRAVDPGLGEAEWSDAAAFEGYAGLGDAAIWNGAASLAATMRYLATGTDADYDRMERKIRDLLLQFDVTGIPGYLARFHYLDLPAGSPNDPRYALSFENESGPRFRPIDTAAVPDLPAHYTEGVDIGGEHYDGTAMYAGNPSIDQYGGPRIGFSLAYNLLRDDSLKRRISDHMTCYLKRLRRIEIRNLQGNPEALESIANLLTESTEVALDPDDIDITQTDTIVMYASMNINHRNEETFDRSCPDSVQTEPARILDATSGDFLLQMLSLGADFADDSDTMGAIDHVYVANVRGADAIHLMHLAALAYYFTGEDEYLRFLQEDLIRDLDTIRVGYTAAAFNSNRYCRKFYGHHISFSPTWAFLRLLETSDLKTDIQTIVDVEMWQKEMFDQSNTKFNLMYAGEVPAGIASARDEALAQAVSSIEAMGGNGGVLSDPRRLYSVDPAEAIANLGANTFVCPTQAEVDSCEAELTFLGVTLPGADITQDCTGDARECVTESGECTHGLAAGPIPINDRQYADFAWQRNPFAIPGPHAVSGNVQSAGLDVTEEFWLARFYGFVSDGDGQALAWRDVGACE